MAKAKKKTVKKNVKKSVKKKTANKKTKKSPAKKAAPKKAPAKKAPKSSAKKTASRKTVARPAKPVKKVSKKASVTKAPATAARSGASRDLADFVTPLDDRIIVRLTEADKRTPGGLFIPDTVADVSGNLEGRVVAVGRGHRDPKGRVRPMDVKTGDRVLFSEYSGSKIRLKDEDFVILREGDVTGVLS